MIMRDVNLGWLIRYIHANGASFFFGCMYIHIGKALYYGSYRKPRVLVWIIGVIILIATMATGFMGYKKNSSPNSCNYGFRKNKFNNKLNSNYNNKLFKFNYNQIRLKSYYVSVDRDETDPIEIFDKLGIRVENYWENLDDHSVRSQMITKLKNKAGIYIIINKINLNKYVGSATPNYLFKRFINHLLNYNGSKLLKRAVLKDGLNNFIFGILEYTPEIKSVKDQNKLFELETTYINLILPEYNILKEAGTSIGYKHSDETLQKIKDNYSLERRKYIGELQKNRIWSEESKQKLREIAFNRSVNYLSDEGRQKISNINSIELSLYDIENNNYICKFKNINTAAHYLCSSYKTIQRCLDLGHIYIPNLFINHLKDDYMGNNNDLLKNIKKEDLMYLNSRGTLSKQKSGLKNKDWNTKFIIKRNL